MTVEPTRRGDQRLETLSCGCREWVTTDIDLLFRKLPDGSRKDEGPSSFDYGYRETAEGCERYKELENLEACVLAHQYTMGEKYGLGSDEYYQSVNAHNTATCLLLAHTSEARVTTYTMVEEWEQ
jgi:hypothetical protein